jgi:lysophospholipase L1-like esterase
MTKTEPRPRLAVALAALLAWPLLVLLDSGVALARGWEPRGMLFRAVTLACLAVAGLVIAVALLPPGRRLLARHWAPLVSFTVSLSLAGLAVEALAWRFPGLLANRYAHSRGPGVHRVFRPDPRWVAGIHGESRYTTNELGIRGGPLPKPGTAYSILCIGGSTTECTYLDDDETWPHLLMAELDARSGRLTWVGGLGISGYTSHEHLDFLRHAPQVRRFDAAVFLIGINDLIHFLNNSLEIGPRPLWRRSALLSAAASALQRRTLRHLLYEVEDPTGANMEPRRQLRREAPVRRGLPDLTPGLRDYGERIADLDAACRGWHIRCVFLTQPVLWRADLGRRESASLWMGSDEAGRFYPPGELRSAMDRYNATLVAGCSRLGLECVDLAAPLSGREDVFLDDCHFTEAGARQVAGLVAAYFLAHPGGPRP